MFGESRRKTYSIPNCIMEKMDKESKNENSK